MNETEKYGYYHATNEGGYISWYDFTKEIYRQVGYKTEVLSATTAEYGLSKAARLFNSRQDKSKLVEVGFTPLPTWQDNHISGYHFRPNILPNLGAVGEKAGLKKQDTNFSDPHRNKPAGTVSSLVRISYYTLDYILGWHIRVRKD